MIVYQILKLLLAECEIIFNIESLSNISINFKKGRQWRIEKDNLESNEFNKSTA